MVLVMSRSPMQGVLQNVFCSGSYGIIPELTVLPRGVCYTDDNQLM